MEASGCGMKKNIIQRDIHEDRQTEEVLMAPGKPSFATRHTNQIKYTLIVYQQDDLFTQIPAHVICLIPGGRHILSM